MTLFPSSSSSSSSSCWRLWFIITKCFNNMMILLLLTTTTIISTIITTTTSSCNALEINPIADWSCDLRNDDCPRQFDGICQSNTIDECSEGDCGDCDYDTCQLYGEDCIGCLEHGCYYCSELGICTNSNQYVFDTTTTTTTTTSENSSQQQQQQQTTTAGGKQPSYCSKPEDFLTNSCTKPNSIFTDPYFSLQSWLFEQINIEQVWREGIKGSGIKIRVNDDGVEINHPEFVGPGKFDLESSCPNNYLPQSTSRISHGTVIASIAAGIANNDVCGVGVAPDASISSCYAILDPATAIQSNIDKYHISVNAYGTDACKPERRRKLLYSQKEEEGGGGPLDNSNNNDNIDDFIDQGDERSIQTKRRRIQACPFTNVDPNDNNNPCNVCDFTNDDDNDEEDDLSDSRCQRSIINYCDEEENYEQDLMGCIEYLDLFIRHGRCFYNTLSSDEQEALTKGIMEGRDGKGMIYVWASGNTYHAGDDTNFQGFINTRLTISVGSTATDGRHSSFSTSGSALLVSAPGSDFEDSIRLYGANSVSANSGSSSDCTEVQGTSFSCAIVAGVVALMLEVNPNLGWRDVQGILAATSNIVTNDPLDTTLTTNGAGLQHSNFYGFGLVDAHAAVMAAKSWELFGPEEMRLGESGILDIDIPDDKNEPITSTISISPPAEGGVFVVESVAVYLDVRHGSRGDLNVVLTSPAGTQSILSPGNRPENTQLYEDERWKLLTVRSWGETAAGDWTISISDISDGYVDESCIDYPWEGVFVDDVGELSLFCSTATRRYWCFDGQIQQDAPDEFLSKVDDEFGRTPVEACCDCGGGGFNRTNIVDKLVQWRIQLYGRSMESAPTIAPIVPTTAAPFASSSTAPTVVESPPDDGSPTPTTANDGSGGRSGRGGMVLCHVLYFYWSTAVLHTFLLWMV